MYKNLIKFGRVFVEICERTDKQTNKQTDVTDTLIVVLSTRTGAK